MHSTALWRLNPGYKEKDMCIQSFLLNDIYSRIVPMIPFSKVHFHAHLLYESNVSAVSLDHLDCINIVFADCGLRMISPSVFH